MQCLILAGGLGTRMAVQTQQVPKALIPVHGKPFAHYQLDLLVREGIRSVVFSIGYKGQMIRESVGDGSKWNIPVHYVDEGTNLLGTGGAVRKAVDSGLLEESFFILNGDSYLPISVAPVWEAFQFSGKPALMTVFENGGKWDASNVKFKEGQLFYQKNVVNPHLKEMNYIDYGLTVVSQKAIRDEIPAEIKFDLAEFFFKLSSRGEVAGYEVFQRFYEIGSPQGLKDFESYSLAVLSNSGSSNSSSASSGLRSSDLFSSSSGSRN